MTLNKPEPSGDILQVEHENDADAKRVLLLGKTAGGVYLPLLVDGFGSLIATNYVPYTGATANVDLGNHSLTAGTATLFGEDSEYNLLVGYSNSAGNYSTVLGYGATALTNDVSIGFNAYAKDHSVAIGDSSYVNGNYSTGIGWGVTISNNDEIKFNTSNGAGVTKTQLDIYNNIADFGTNSITATGLTLTNAGAVIDVTNSLTVRGSVITSSILNLTNTNWTNYMAFVVTPTYAGLTTADGDLIFESVTADKDIQFIGNDGGVVKTITWDLSADKLKHSAGLFDFDDDNILTTGTLGAGAITGTSLSAGSGTISTTGIATFGTVKSGVGGVGLDDQGSIYYTYLKQYFGTPYNTQDRVLSIHLNDGDRILSMSANLTVAGYSSIDQNVQVLASPTFASLTLTAAAGLTLGTDVTAPTVNIPGNIKLWSAGNNAFYTTITAGVQTATETYTLPLAMATANSQALLSTTAGVMSWGTNFGANDILTSGTLGAGLTTVTNLTDSGLTITRIPYASTGGLLIDSSVFTFTTATGLLTTTGITATGTGTFASVNIGGAGAYPLYITGTTDNYGRMAELIKTSYDLSGSYTQYAFEVQARASTGGSRSMYTLQFDARYTGSGTQTGTIAGVQGQIYNTGAGNTSGNVGVMLKLYQDTAATAAIFTGLQTGGFIVDTKTATITTYKGIEDLGVNGRDGTVTTAYNFYGNAHQKETGTFTNAYGILIEKETVGTTINAGLVLLGDSTSADIANCGAGIVFGAGKDAAISYDGTDLCINTALVGSGVIKYGTHANVTTETVTGYITIKDSAGNVRKLAVVS